MARVHQDTDHEEPHFDPEPEGDPAASSSDETRRAFAVRLLRHVEESVHQAIALIEGGDPQGAARSLAELVAAKQGASEELEHISRSLEGIFDGERMVGSDGHSYPVPPNYASKSHLVEGDVLKLSIRSDGQLVYKQIGPVERRSLTGTLLRDANGGYAVRANGEAYRVLHASISFYHGEVGDDVAILIPKSSRAVWAAVEHVLKK